MPRNDSMQGAEITAEVLYSQLMLERLRDPVVARGACMRSAWRAGAASSLPGYARLPDELRIASLTTTCLLLGVIAYNLGNLLRRLVLPLPIQGWSLTSLQQRLFQTC